MEKVAVRIGHQSQAQSKNQEEVDSRRGGSRGWSQPKPASALILLFRRLLPYACLMHYRLVHYPGCSL